MPPASASALLPLHPGLAPWIALSPLALFLGTFAPLFTRRGPRFALAAHGAAFVLALAGLVTALQRAPGARLLTTPALMVLDARAFRLEAVLAAGPVAFGGAALVALAAMLAAWRAEPGARGLGWTSLLAGASVSALLAGDLVLFVGALVLLATALLGLLRAAARDDELPGTGVRAFLVVQLGAAAWLAGAVALAWSLGGTGWNAASALQKTSGLAVLKGLPAAAEVSLTRLAPAPLGIDEAVAAGDKRAESATWIVPGPTFSAPSLRNLIVVPSSGIGARLEAMRLFGVPVLFLVALLWIAGAVLGTGQIVAGWWRGLDAVPPGAKLVVVLATALPPLVMLGRFEFLVQRANAALVLAALGLAGALVAIGSELPASRRWRSLRIVAPLATVALGVAAGAPGYLLAIGFAVAALGFVAFRVQAVALPARGLRTSVRLSLELVAGIVRASSNVVSGLDGTIFEKPWEKLGSALFRRAHAKKAEPPIATRALPLALGIVAAALLAALALQPTRVAPLAVGPALVALLVAAASFLAALDGPRRLAIALALQVAGTLVALASSDLRLVALALAACGAGHVLAKPLRASGGTRLEAFVLGFAPALLLASSFAFSDSPLVARWLVVSAFLLRLPLVPFHAPTDALLAEVPAPYAMFAAGAGPLVAVTGLVRIAQASPQALVPLAPTLAVVAAASLAWSALALLAQEDLRRLASAPAPVCGSLAVLALASHDVPGLEAALLLACAGALSAALLTASTEALVSRAGHRHVDGFGGLVARAPELALASAVACGAVLGLPGTLGFPATVLALVGSFGAFPRLALLALGAVVVAATALAWTVDRVHLGPFHERYKRLPAPSSRERLVLGLLGLALVVAGLWPEVLVGRAREVLTGVATAAANG